MKNTGRLTFCAVMAGLAAAFMLTSLFPYLTYAIPAVAGLFIMVAMIETGVKWASVSYIVSAVIVLIMPADPEAKMLYIALFGYYPILKVLLERVKNRILEYVLKFLCFNAAILISYCFIGRVLGIDMSDMNDFGKYTSLILLVAANVVFPIYDLAVSRVAAFYIARLHRTISRIILKK